jgi:hypothetical protein
MEIAVGLIICIAIIWVSIKESREHPEAVIGRTWGKYFLMAVIVIGLLSCIILWLAAK